MNAYELADAIQDWDSDGQWDTPAATMLRQQADRIAELEKENKDLKFHIKWIEGGEQTIKPIGYLDCTDYQNLYDGEISECVLRNTNSTDDTDVALFASIYTHPHSAESVKVKQLSDEEILRIAEKHLSAGSEFLSTGEMWYEGEIEFARAIIKEITE